MFVVGICCALGAAVAYGSASVLQSVGVRRAGSAGAVVRDPLYLIGLCLDGGGFVVAVIALQFLPLFLVQSMVATSVVWTALLGVLIGSHLGRSGWIGLAVAMVGLILLGLGAAAEGGRELSAGWRWVLLACAAPILAIGLLGHRRKAPSTVAFAAGLAFSLVAVNARSLEFPHPIWHLLGDPSLWALAANGIAGTVLFAMAVEIGMVTRISAVTFTTETVLPSAVGLLFLGDTVRTGFWPVAGLGFVLAVGGAIALSRFSEGIPETVAPVD